MEGSILVNQLKNIISLVDMLRDIGLDNLLSLPKIVILGNQSSGKSSLVEQIVGLDFLPRGNGVVTRRPLELRMNNIVNLPNPYAEFDEILQGKEKKKFTDFNQVRKKIIEVTDNICKGKDIKDIPIVLNIFSTTCPNLTIVDLPGITLIPVQGQPQNIHQITRQMAIRYIKQPRSIILCVIPANQDIVNSQALHLMRQIDPYGERSIGCLTKIDIMNRGDDATRMLKNQQVPLKYGYVGIKNRCQYDIDHNISVAESLKAQKQYFSTSPIYSRLSRQLVTTESLTKKLTQILYQQIKGSIPEILSQIKQKKLATQNQLRKISPLIFSNVQEIVQYVMKCASDFGNNFNNSINGLTNSQLYAEPISSCIQKHLYGLYQEQYDEPATASYSDQQMLQIINNYGSTFLNFYAIDTFTATINPILKKLQAPAHLLNNNIHQLLLSQANSLMNKIFNPNFPEFNRKFAGIVKGVLEQNRAELQNFLTNLLQAQIHYYFTNDREYLFQDFSLTKKQKDQATKVKEGYMIYGLRKRVDAYYKLVVHNLRDLIPKQIFNFLITKSQKELSLATFKFINDQKKLKQMFNEPAEQSKRRQQLQKELKIYQQSEKRINRDPNIVKGMKQEREKMRTNKQNHLFQRRIEGVSKNTKNDNDKKSITQNEQLKKIIEQEKLDENSHPINPLTGPIPIRRRDFFFDLFGTPKPNKK